MTKREKVSVTTYIRADQAGRLRRLRELTHVPTAVRVREGIDLLLERHRAELGAEQTEESDGK